MTPGRSRPDIRSLNSLRANSSKRQRRKPSRNYQNCCLRFVLFYYEMIRWSYCPRVKGVEGTHCPIEEARESIPTWAVGKSRSEFSPVPDLGGLQDLSGCSDRGAAAVSHPSFRLIFLRGFVPPAGVYRLGRSNRDGMPERR